MSKAETSLDDAMETVYDIMLKRWTKKQIIEYIKERERLSKADAESEQPTENSEWIFAIGKTNYDGSHQSKPIRELVRCKDCKHAEDYNEDYACKLRPLICLPADWFCADGERKEQNE